MDAGYLSSDTQWQGRFWLPGQESGEQRGTLTYSPDRGVRLALIGGFDDAEWLPGPSPNTMVLSSGTKQWAIIHGTVGSTQVTLIDCVVQRSTSNLFGGTVSEQEIRAESLVFGALIDSAESPVFSGLKIELENLTEWHYTPDVVNEIERHEDLTRGTRWRIAVQPVDSITVDVDDLAVELGRWYRLPSHDLRRGRLASSTFAVSHLTLKSVQPRSVAEWTDSGQAFQDLLSLAMDAPCAVLRQTLIPSETLFLDEEAGSRGELPLYAKHIVVGDPDAPGVRGGDALFTLGVEGVSFETVVPLWVETREKFRITLDMILGLRYVDAGYIQTQLITAVAAAEAMHEALDLDPPISTKEFRDLKKQLLEKVPDGRRQWLREKLGRNSHTLLQQLRDLASLPDANVMSRLLPNSEAWAEATKKARNRVAHGGDSGADVLLQYAITQVTRAVVIVNLLHHLNIPADRLKYVLMANRTLSEAADLAHKNWPADAKSEEQEEPTEPAEVAIQAAKDGDSDTSNE